jgi:hypothetical protein
LYSQSQAQYPYHHYSLTVRYDYDPGLLPLPVANGGACTSQDTFRFIQVQAPTTRKVVEFSAIRQNAPPAIPNPNALDQNLVLLSYSISPVSPIISPSGRDRLYELHGRYVYGLRNPICPGASVPGATSPVDVTALANLAVQQGQFIDGLF